MSTVRELFSELFAYVLLFEQSSQPGKPQRSYEQVRGEVSALLEQQRVAAEHQGMRKEDYENACFAAVAWTDETILN